MSTYTFGYLCYDDENPSSLFPHEKSINTSVTFPDDGTWVSVLSEFCNFLSSVYGYSIKDKVYVAGFANKLDALFPHPSEYKEEPMLGSTKPDLGEESWWDVEDEEWDAFQQWRASRKGDDE